jgi:PKD repeat protein
MKRIYFLRYTAIVLMMTAFFSYYAQSPVAGFTVAPNPVCAGQTVQVTDLSTGNPTAWSYTLSGFGPNGAATSTLQNPVFTLNGQGTFTIFLRAANSSGSSSVVTHTVQVLPPPNANVAPATQTTCIGGTVSSLSIVAGGGGGGNIAGLTYTWSTGATTSLISLPSQNSTTIISVVISGTNGCKATRNATVNVSTPTVSINSNPVAICPGVNSTLTANGSGTAPFTFTWSTGANTRTTTASVAGVYNVTVTSGAGCTATQAITLATTTTLQVNILANNTLVCSGNTLILGATGAGNYTWSTGASNNTLPITPTVTTTYTVGGSLGTCTGSAALTISVNTTPTIVISSNPAQLCAGKPATISASGATNYTWQPGAIIQPSVVITPSVNVSYTVRGSTPGCPTRATTFSLAVLPTPMLQITSNASAICAGDEVQISASGAQSYSWSTGATASTVIVSPSVTTNYTVSGSSAAGCSATFSYVQNVEECTALVSHLKNTAVFQVYPSPADKNISVKGTNLREIQLFDLKGQNVLTQRLEGASQADVSTEVLMEGVYLMKIETRSGEAQTIRVLIRH